MRRTACALAIAALLPGCAKETGVRHTETSYFAPANVAEIAAHSPVRVEARVVSAATVYPIPPDTPLPGADGDAPPSKYAYEVARVEVLKVFGARTGVAPGDTIDVGVPVLDPSYVATPGEDLGAFTRAGETFRTGRTGVLFLTDVLSLGSFGQGRAVMGFAEYGTATAATMRGVFGPLRGREVQRTEVAAAAR
jgi:hypothetical protein